MSINRSALLMLLACGVLLQTACATLQGREPIQVMMVGIEPLHAEGLELRMLVKLRVQNPNDFPLDFNGVSVQMDVRGKRFASGVSDARGSVPRFGETIIGVPVSISVFGIARQAVDALTSDYRGKLGYEMTGRLAGPSFNSMTFTSQGELTLPEEIFPSDQ